MDDRPEIRRLISGSRTQPHLEGRYANYFEVGHNAFEFIIDFGQYHAEDEVAQMQSRVVTGPVYAKLLAGMLRDSIERYEEEHGTIRSAEEELDPVEVVQESLDGFLEARPGAARRGPAPNGNKQQ